MEIKINHDSSFWGIFLAVIAEGTITHNSGNTRDVTAGGNSTALMA